MEDTFGTCVFPIIDEHGNIISAELHGTRTGPGKKRFKQTVSEKSSSLINNVFTL